VTATASLINQTIGNYRVTGLLGEGGMGAVYLAEHPIIGRKVAIKLLHALLAQNQDIVSRFFNEARAIHMIAHENIVEILDFGQTTDGQPYFIMEYLTGESLSDTVERGPMPPADVETIGVQMCRALGAAHAKGIVHRDLKPHNVQLIDKGDGAVHVKILDFGVAKILSASDGAQSVKTRAGSLMGTPLYMSPEQCKGAGALDHRTDIYSLGVMLFEMLAGRPPFMAEGVGELFAKHMLEEAPLLTDAAPTVPPHMAAAVMKSLSKEPRDRFQTMEEFRQALVGEVKLAAPTRAGRRLATAAREVETLPPRASTTLSSATSVIDEPAAKPRRSRVITGLVAGITVAAGIGLVGMLENHPKIVAVRAPAPAVAALAPPIAVTPVKKTVTIRFEADPAGSHLYSKDDDRDLGVVPVELQLPRGSAPAVYLLRLDGYREVALVADPTSDRTLHVSLDKLTSPAAAATDAKHHPPRHAVAAKRPKSPVDDDSLATPSF
jgi:predicted Ser/Thr protein kinase